MPFSVVTLLAAGKVRMRGVSTVEVFVRLLPVIGPKQEGMNFETYPGKKIVAYGKNKYRLYCFIK